MDEAEEFARADAALAQALVHLKNIRNNTAVIDDFKRASAMMDNVLLARCKVRDRGC